MSDIEVTLPVAGLAAVLPFAAKNDIRYYLNGVLVEVTASSVTFIGTNGEVLAAAKCECYDNGVETSFILRREDAEAILKNMAREDALRVRTNGPLMLEVEFGAHRIKTARIEGKFPNWRVAAAVEPGQRGMNASVQHRFLSLIDKSVRGSKKFSEPQSLRGVAIELNGPDRALTALVRGDHLEIAYIIMPLRDGGGNGTTPAASDAGLLSHIVEQAKAAA